MANPEETLSAVAGRTAYGDLIARQVAAVAELRQSVEDIRRQIEGGEGG